MNNQTTQTTRALIQRGIVAPKARGGKFRHAVRLVVIEGPAEAVEAYEAGRQLQERFLKRDGVRIIREAYNVDSRYRGPRSAYGQAYAELDALADAI